MGARKCLLSFDVESCVFRFPIQNYGLRIYDFACFVVCV